MNTTPILLLVRPQMGENIGAVARAMSNFGLSELRIVAPRDGWPNPKAIDMASGGAYILEQARIFETVPEALADVHMAYATSARIRDIAKPVVDPREAASGMREALARAERVALLFGPERTGLTNEDLALCDALIAIPTDAKNPSLNVAQSAVIMGYEWYRQSHHNSAQTPVAAHDSRAAKEELQGFFTHLETLLDRNEYFRTPEKKPLMWQNLRNLFTRAALNDQEIRTLRGMLRSLDSGRHG